jgi:hypothetical protein
MAVPVLEVFLRRSLPQVFGRLDEIKADGLLLLRRAGFGWSDRPKGAVLQADRGLSGGYGTEEPERAGAYRVYDDPAMLLRCLDEDGVRTS